MSQSFSKQANNLWYQIYQVVRENCSAEYKGATPHDDLSNPKTLKSCAISASSNGSRSTSHCASSPTLLSTSRNALICSSVSSSAMTSGRPGELLRRVQRGHAPRRYDGEAPYRLSTSRNALICSSVSSSAMTQGTVGSPSLPAALYLVCPVMISWSAEITSGRPSAMRTGREMVCMRWCGNGQSKRN